MKMIELVIKIPKETYEKAKIGAFNCTVINKAILDGVVLTERQEVTNGDIIKALFPSATFSILKSDTEKTKVAAKWNFEPLPSYYNLFYLEWWNAPYKKGETDADRPCTACEFHTDNGCSKWRCVFEE